MPTPYCPSALRCLATPKVIKTPGPASFHFQTRFSKNAFLFKIEDLGYSVDELVNPGAMAGYM
jgi:hypothetical protein